MILLQLPWRKSQKVAPIMYSIYIPTCCHCHKSYLVKRRKIQIRPIILLFIYLCNNSLKTPYPTPNLNTYPTALLVLPSPSFA